MSFKKIEYDDGYAIEHNGEIIYQEKENVSFPNRKAIASMLEITDASPEMSDFITSMFSGIEVENKEGTTLE